MKILLDNGHGYDTMGKCSPDGKLKEYEWNRDVARRIEARLKGLGYDVQRIVTEASDIPLSERCRRVNKICAAEGAKNCVLVSVHINAAGSDGQWHNATGWSGWVAKNASANSKKLAQFLYEEAERKGLKGNRCVPPCKYWEANFAIVSKTNCPAVLTENLFQDNYAEAQYLMTEEGKDALADLHARALIRYANNLKS